ncbi:MAG: type II toxin-antitoxin system PemK/MazF family toxin [Trueperaceae bacterium]|nr:type II toxin-antitoxin system PemK/MazF family toxin [Trueperaceae bacterium]
MNRGEVYWADLRPRSGSEQRGRRPVVIVSHDAFNHLETWRSLIVVPLSTSTRQARRGPTAVVVEAGIAGLERASVALCHQPTTIDRSKLSELIGRLPDEAMRLIEAGLLAAMDLRRGAG